MKPARHGAAVPCTFQCLPWERIVTSSISANHRFYHRMQRSVAVIVFACLAWLFLGASPAMATITSCSNPMPGGFTFALPSGTFSVPRNMGPNTLVVPWSDWFVGGTSVWSCTGLGAPNGEYNGAAVWMQSLVPTGQTYTAGGISYTVFGTNVAGIGMVVGQSAYTPSGWQSDLTGKPYGYLVVTTPSPGGGWGNTGNWGPLSFGFRVRVAFVTTGTVQAGTVSFPGQVGSVGMVDYVSGTYPVTPTHGPMNIAPIGFVGGPTFAVVACQTPDVRVPLGQWPQTTFTGIGSTSGAKPVNISLNSCPAGLNSITYRVDPVTTVVNATQSVVALDASSSATGVGVQLLDSSGTQPVPLQTWITFTGYNAAMGGDYTIPLQARYYETAAAVSPGVANTAMTFTMQYQ
ncbi:Type-1 fimbrial protein, A chain [Dyella sp. AD56]|nr:Type-1 fimbrial protein, A chain [Dyella sp. AD56]